MQWLAADRGVEVVVEGEGKKLLFGLGSRLWGRRLRALADAAWSQSPEPEARGARRQFLRARSYTISYEKRTNRCSSASRIRS